MAKDKICRPFVGIIAPENKFTVDTIDDLKSRNYLTIGDIVDLNGYYTAGDGAHHKRKIGATDDGSGVQLANGLWANIVHNGEVCYSMFGAIGNIVDVFVFSKTHKYCNTKKTKLVCSKSFDIMLDSKPSDAINTDCDFNNSRLLINDNNYEKSVLNIQDVENPFVTIHSGTGLTFERKPSETVVGGVDIKKNTIVHIHDNIPFCQRYIRNGYENQYRAQIFKSVVDNRLVGDIIYPLENTNLTVKTRRFTPLKTVVKNLEIVISIKNPIADDKILSVLKVRKDSVVLDSIKITAENFIDPGTRTHIGDIISFATCVGCSIRNSSGYLETKSSVSIYSLINSIVSDFTIDKCNFSGTWGAHQSTCSSYINVKDSTFNRIDCHNYGAFFKIENSTLKEVSLGNYHKQLDIHNSNVWLIGERGDYSVGFNSSVSMKNSNLNAIEFSNYAGGEVTTLEHDFKRNFVFEGGEVFGDGIVFFTDKPLLGKKAFFDSVVFKNCTLNSGVCGTNFKTIKEEDVKDVSIILDNVTTKSTRLISAGALKETGFKTIKNSSITLEKYAFFDYENCDLKFLQGGWGFFTGYNRTIKNSKIDITNLVSGEKKFNMSNLASLTMYDCTLHCETEIVELTRVGVSAEDIGSFINCKFSDDFVKNYSDVAVGRELNYDSQNFFPSNTKTEFPKLLKTVSFQTLDTPYYTLKMQEQGIYDDYVAYRDELHEYENNQTSDETMLLPVLHEPVIPESVRVFAEKYKLI